MSKSLKKKVKEMRIGLKRSQDFDPEDQSLAPEIESSDSESNSDDEPASAGRDHYEAVSKSKLRKPEKIELDAARYSSRPVSRAALQAESDDDGDENDPLAPQEYEEDDPFAAEQEVTDEEESSLSGGDLGTFNADFNEDNDEEIDSDGAFGSGEETTLRAKGFKFRGSGKPAAPSRYASVNGSSSSKQDAVENDIDEDDDDSEDLEMSDTGSDISVEHLDDASESNGDEDDSEDSDGDELGKPLSSSNSHKSYPASDREKLRSLISSDTATISASLSQAASADAKKGHAVKQQYQTFDRFLDARIKLQKGLTAANELAINTMALDEEGKAAVRKAEEAAFNLFNTIESIRNDILDAGSKSKKRKRSPPVTTLTSVRDVHRRLDDLEEQYTAERRTILDKWANKTRATNAIATSKSKLQADQTTTNLTTVLDAYLLTSAPKLIDESKILPSTTTSTTKHESDQNGHDETNSSLPPYQDTLFYQALLRDLIATKSYINPSATNSTSAALTFNINDKIALPTKIHRQVDRKASKGRKIRYTVHEKLENFTAAMGTQSVGDQWTDGAVREFFSSLMGMKNQLAEHGDLDNDMDVDGGENDDYANMQNGEFEALRLFRS